MGFSFKLMTYIDDSKWWLLLCFQFCLKASAGNLEDEEPKMSIIKANDGWKIDFSGQKPATPLLDNINYPVHMKNLSTRV